MKYIYLMCMIMLSAISCTKSVTRPDVEPAAKKNAQDARPYAAKWIDATELQQFDWQQQTALPISDSLGIIKILKKEQEADRFTYLLAHQRSGVFTDLVLHTIYYQVNASGAKLPVRMQSSSYVSGKSAAGPLRASRGDASVQKGLRVGTTRQSLVAPGGTLPLITITGFYSDGSAGGNYMLPSPVNYVLIGGMLYQQGGGGINNEGDLAMLDPLWVPDTGSPQVIDLTYNRVYNGMVYNINNYPYKDKGFPWFWMENPEWRSPEGYLYSRMAQLYEELEQNPKALINCQELQALMAYGPMFQQISTFQAPPSVVSRLNEARQQAPNFIVDNFNLQSLQDASGSVVNCDFFPVRITQLPTGFTAESLLEYFRTHINEFISPSQNKSFHPYQDGSFNDAARFFSPYEASIGTLIHIDMLNDGSVIISDYQRSTYAAGNKWNRFTFSTLETPLDYEHPVAGNRQFGIYSNPGNPNEFTFYTMGVDRTWDPFFKLGNATNMGFADADALWQDIQSNMQKFITQHGGTASKYNPSEYISRPKWSDVEDYLKGSIDLLTFKSRIGC